MINTILFDFDGVLVNSEPLHYEAEKKLIEDNGGDTRTLMEANKATLGFSVKDTVAFYKDFFHLPLPADELLGQHDAILSRLLDESLELMEGIPALLDLLVKNQFHFAAASSGTLQYISHAMKRLNIYHLFKGKIFCVDMVEKGKPDPAIFLYAARELGVLPGNCLVIEDSLNGIIAASRAGMRSFYLNSNQTEDIGQYHAERIGSISEAGLRLLNLRKEWT